MHPSEEIEVHRKQIIYRVIDYLKKNYTQEIKLENLSLIAFLSPGYFCRQFKLYTGLTVSEYTQKLRIDEACRLLLQTDKKVIEIVNLIGYRDLKHFNQVFKKLVGKSPQEYRKWASTPTNSL